MESCFKCQDKDDPERPINTLNIKDMVKLPYKKPIEWRLEPQEKSVSSGESPQGFKVNAGNLERNNILCQFQFRVKSEFF